MTILLSLIAVPILFLALMLLTKRRSGSLATISTFISLVIVVYLLIFSIINKSASINESYSYISSLGIGFDLSLNSISLVLLLMSSIILFVTALSGNIKKEMERTASILLVLFQIGATGLFLSGNLFLFFIFWDIGVIAPFFMINILGSANRRNASYKFIIYEIFASALLLFGIILIYIFAPGHSLSIAGLSSSLSQMPMYVQQLTFILLFLAFMINMPIFPLHSWLPDAHTEASTQGSMVLSGILTKFGGFGMLIIFTSFTIAHNYSFYIAVLSVVSAFYAALLIMRQHDIKRIVAYTTIIEMSIIMFAITAMNTLGLYGALFAMLAHGLVVALMFLAAGSIEHAFSERSIDVLKGIAADAKLTSYVFLVGILAITGVPLTTGFIADVAMFLGAIGAYGAYAVIPLFSLVLLGGFMYYVVNKSIFSTKERTQSSAFIGSSQKIGYAILLASIFIFGIIPSIILNIINI